MANIGTGDMICVFLFSFKNRLWALHITNSIYFKADMAQLWDIHNSFYALPLHK